MKPIIPPSVEDVIAKLDQAGAPLDDHTVRQALDAAREALVNPSEAEKLGAWAEVLAFALANGKHGDSPWGTYFRPIASGTLKDGSTFYSPDIAGTDAEVIGHWSHRAKTVKHPVLSRLLKNAAHSAQYGHNNAGAELSDARSGYRSGRALQLCVAGATRARRSSTAADSCAAG